MNAPGTPCLPVTPTEHRVAQEMPGPSPPKRSYTTMASMPSSRPQMAVMSPPPYAVRARPGGDMHPPLQYASPTRESGYHRPTATTFQDMSDPKRRRVNGDGSYIRGRDPFIMQAYQYSPQAVAFSRAEMQPPPPHHAGTAGVPPLRGVYQRPAGPVLPASRHAYAPIHNPSFTLPPLQTTTTVRPTTQVTVDPSHRQQQSGVNAMIMSIPVLNKIHTLSQIAPPLSATGATSPTRKVTGAIVAVEGVDAAYVQSMTKALAEQLERAGKFAVRVFDGPNPHEFSGKEPTLTTGTLLEVVGAWHRVSREMIEYVSTTSPARDLPGFGETSRPGEADADCLDGNRGENPLATGAALGASSAPALSYSTLSRAAQAQARPISTNNTVPRSTDPSFRDVDYTPARSRTESEASSNISPKTVPSGLAQGAGESQSQSQTQPLLDLQSQSEPPPLQRQTTSPSSAAAAAAAAGRIPIALVAHYQLTTVDVSATSMAITDNYSPLSHWKWLASLWRGCAGPDVSVVIAERDLDDDLQTPHAANASNGPVSRLPPTTTAAPVNNSCTKPAGPVPAGVPASAISSSPSSSSSPSPAGRPGITSTPPAAAAGAGAAQDATPVVEVRLAEARAVVVRLPRRGGGGGGSRNPNPNPNTADPDDDNEEEKDAKNTARDRWWDRAKRRVAFEVEEFLRR